MLHDLYFSLPDSDDIISHLKETARDEQLELSCDFDPRMTLGIGIAEGMYELSNWVGNLVLIRIEEA